MAEEIENVGFNNESVTGNDNTPIITVDIDGTGIVLDGHSKINVIRNCHSCRGLNRFRRVELALKTERIFKHLATEDTKISEERGQKWKMPPQ